MTGPAEKTPPRELPDLARPVLEFAIGFCRGYNYFGPVIRQAIRSIRAWPPAPSSGGRHRAAPVPGHVVIVPPEAVGCECWCHRASDEWIGGE